MKTRTAFGLAAIAYACTASADYVVTQIDYEDPDTHQLADFTELWQSANTGQVAGDAVFGTVEIPFYYDPETATFTVLPLPPGFDGVTSHLAPRSVNDVGVLAGPTVEPGGRRGFIYSGGTYSFFSHPDWVHTDARTISNPTTAHPQGLVVAIAFNDLAELNHQLNSDIGFIYDPVTTNRVTIDTPGSYYTIVQSLNAAGQIVGSANYHFGSGAPREDGAWSFLFTPTTDADPMLGGTLSYFRINGMPTRARGLNDNGVLAAGVFDPDGNVFAYVGTSAGYTLIDVPSVAGAPDSDCPTTFAFPSGVNNAGQVTGSFTDANCAIHGFIATPAVPPSGTTVDGAYTFDTEVVANEPVFIDPPVARGYDYATGKHDPRIATVRLPLGIGNNKFILVVQNKAYSLNAGQLFDFRTHGFKQGAKAFQVACIDPAASLDPANPRAFPTELTFVDSGKFTGTQKPVTDSRYGDESQADCRSRLLKSR